MMAELPAEMNTEIAEIVRARVKAGDWPNGIEASNAIIKALIMERVAKRIRPVEARCQEFSACQIHGMSSSMRLIL